MTIIEAKRKVDLIDDGRLSVSDTVLGQVVGQALATALESRDDVMSVAE